MEPRGFLNNKAVRTPIQFDHPALLVNKTKRVVYISGCWDLFHIGHMVVLERASQLGDELIVGVNTDEFVRTYKANPVIPFEQRKRIVASLRCVDRVIKHTGFLDMHGFDGLGVTIRAVGPDYGRYREQQECLETMGRMGIRLVVLPRTLGVSTQQIKENCYEAIQDSINRFVMLGAVGMSARGAAAHVCDHPSRRGKSE